jgi:predicted SAM-dependent methyltransferase
MRTPRALDRIPDEQTAQAAHPGQRTESGMENSQYTTRHHVDDVGNCTTLTQFADTSICELYASHVLEHLGFRIELPEACERYGAYLNREVY